MYCAQRCPRPWPSAPPAGEKSPSSEAAQPCRQPDPHSQSHLWPSLARPAWPWSPPFTTHVCPLPDRPNRFTSRPPQFLPNCATSLAPVTQPTPFASICTPQPPPNNSMEPPPLRFAVHPERAGDLRPIPASQRWPFHAILALAGRAAHPQGAPRISRPLGASPGLLYNSAPLPSTNRRNPRYNRSASR